MANIDHCGTCFYHNLKESDNNKKLNTHNSKEASLTKDTL